MTTSELAKEVYSIVETAVLSTPTSAEFEMAYQARVAMDRIRFAIKHTEEFAAHIDEMREVGLQLLEAFERLQSAERKFQIRYLRGGPDRQHDKRMRAVINGRSNQRSSRGVI